MNHSLCLPTCQVSIRLWQPLVMVSSASCTVQALSYRLSHTHMYLRFPQQSPTKYFLPCPLLPQLSRVHRIAGLSHGMVLTIVSVAFHSPYATGPSLASTFYLFSFPLHFASKIIRPILCMAFSSGSHPSIICHKPNVIR